MGAMELEEKTAVSYTHLNGVYIRMAIILALLDIPDPVTGKKVLEA